MHFRTQHLLIVLALCWLSSWESFGHEPTSADPRAFGAIMLQLSHDGESLAFSYQGAIWRMSRSGGEARRLTSAGPTFDRDPAWSNDSRRIAYVRSPNFSAGTLAVLDAVSGEPVALPSEVQVQGTICFSRDDRRILGFFQTQGERPRFAWFDLMSGELTNAFSAGVLPAPLDSISRSPVYALAHDNSAIAIVSTRDVPGEQTGNQGPRNDLWRVPFSGAKAERIMTWPARIHEVCWTGDDQSLVIATERGGAHTDLWQLPLADPERQARKLTFGQADEADPHISADDRWLCYTDNRHGSTLIIIRDRATGSESIVTPSRLDFAAPTGRLSMRVAEGDSPEETTARIAIQHENGQFHAPPGSLYRLYGRDLHFYLHDETGLELPAGKYSVRANRGPEYKTTYESFTIQPGEETKVVLKLERWTNQRAEAWVSGESHIHANYGYGHWYNSPTTMRMQCAGEDLTMANLMVANSDGDGVFDREFFLGRPDPQSTDDTVLYWNEEFRSTIWGHMTLLNLKWLVTPIFTGFKDTSHPHDVPMNADIADHVHDQDGFVNYTHPSHSVQDPYGGPYTAKEMPVDVALGKIDSMDIMGNHQANLPVWYRLLNCGFRVPASAGTDCFLNRIPSNLPGAVRVYVHCPGELSYQSWIDNHRAGRTFVSSGPVVRFTVNGQEPGSVIELDAPGSLRIAAQATAQHSVVSLELIINGTSQVLATAPSDKVERELRADTEVMIDQTCWIALRVNGVSGPAQNQPFAHTSPVYITVAGAPQESPEDAKFFMTWIERLRTDVRKRNQIPPSRVTYVEEQLARALAQYQVQVNRAAERRELDNK